MYNLERYLERTQERRQEVMNKLLSKLGNLLYYLFSGWGYILIGLNRIERNFLDVLFDASGRALYLEALFRRSNISSNNDTATNAIRNLSKRNLIMTAVSGGKVTIVLHPRTVEYMASRNKK